MAEGPGAGAIPTDPPLLLLQPHHDQVRHQQHSGAGGAPGQPADGLRQPAVPPGYLGPTPRGGVPPNKPPLPSRVPVSVPKSRDHAWGGARGEVGGGRPRPHTAPAGAIATDTAAPHGLPGCLSPAAPHRAASPPLSRPSQLAFPARRAAGAPGPYRSPGAIASRLRLLSASPGLSRLFPAPPFIGRPRQPGGRRLASTGAARPPGPRPPSSPQRREGRPRVPLPGLRRRRSPLLCLAPPPRTPLPQPPPRSPGPAVGPPPFPGVLQPSVGPERRHRRRAGPSPPGLAVSRSPPAASPPPQGGYVAKGA